MTVKVCLFVDGRHIENRERAIAPSVGDTIVIDCGELVRVTVVNHQWDSPDSVQIMAVAVKER